jgi:hypothetical protein
MRFYTMISRRYLPLRWRSVAVAVVVLLLLAGLPVAVYLDLKDLSEAALRRQAADMNAIISSIRTFYASNVVGRVLESPDKTQVLPNYRSVPGAIPIPATLSIELGRVISEEQSNVGYRFVSDYPFLNRTPHRLDAFEHEAIAELRADPRRYVAAFSRDGVSERLRMASPVMMVQVCVRTAHMLVALSHRPPSFSALDLVCRWQGARRSLRANGSRGPAI